MFLKANLKCYSLLRISQWLLITFWINWYTNSLLRCFVRPWTTWILSSFSIFILHLSYSFCPIMCLTSVSWMHCDHFYPRAVSHAVYSAYHPVLAFFHFLCTEKPMQRSAFKVKCLPNTCIWVLILKKNLKHYTLKHTTYQSNIIICM